MWWLLGTKEKLTEEQAAFLERLKEKSPKVEIAQSLALEFFGMARRREPAGHRRAGTTHGERVHSIPVRAFMLFDTVGETSRVVGRPPPVMIASSSRASLDGASSAGVAGESDTVGR